MKKILSFFLLCGVFFGGFVLLIYSLFDNQSIDDICTQIDERQEI